MGKEIAHSGLIPNALCKSLKMNAIDDVKNGNAGILFSRNIPVEE